MVGWRGGFGVALGGGTARAYAHVGALQALESHGWRPTAVAGTSSGAIVGAMLALGASATELEYTMRQLDVAELWRQGFDPGVPEASLIHGRRLEAWLDRKVFGGATFADTAIPFAAACTDLLTGELTLLREGPLARAVVASCSLPGVFAPVIDGPRALVDGGFVESVPFRALAELDPQRLLGIHAGIDAGRSRFVGVVRTSNASPLGRAWLAWCGRRSGRHAWSRLGRGLALAAASYERVIAAPPDGWLLVTRPPIAWWDFHRSLEAMRAGANAVEAALERGLEAWLQTPSGRPDRPVAA